ncbi:MAG: tape measure protein [Hyphomicrobium sp.]|jgi:tape measure domain-containing protein
MSRTVKVTLSAQVQGYIDGMNKAANSTKQVTGESAKLAAQRESFQQLGGAMVAVGGAVTAIGIAAVKTGIEYNTMQQTTRAALTTLLGSAEAANAQMDKLDAFARTSPFAKTTFIAAQQQMLAFGIETQKVIPYLEAVQDAVAAAGGSNADIEAIVATMSKIQSSSKITAQDLIEFGNRGVNAADLIGSQMGKTGAQIREDITAGSLGATEALDALAAGMSERFDGAAANVKETFAGALDRVKAAWRDFSAELATPLVDPDGGGALVDFLNGLADAMRQFEKLPQPVKEATTTVVLAGGAALLAGGSFLLAVPKIAEFRAAMAALNITAAGTKGALAAATPALIAFAAVPIAAELTGWIDEMRGVTIGASDLEKQIRNVGAASSDIERGLTGGSIFRGMGMDAEIAANNLRQLNTGVGQMKAWFDNSILGEAMSFFFAGMGREAGNAQKQIEELDTAMASMVSSGRTDEAAEAYEYFAEKATEAGWSAERIAEALPEYTAAMESAAPVTKTSADLASEAASALTEQADAARAATDEIFKLIDALMASNDTAQTAEGANARYQQTLAEVAEYVANAQAGLDGYSRSIDENTVEGSKNREMLAGMAADSQAAAAAIYEQELKTLGADQATANYRTRLEQGREALYKVMLDLTGNAEAAQLLTDKLYAMPSQKDIGILLETATATAKLNEWLVPRTLMVYADLARQGDWSTPLKVPGTANGGLHEFADGGFATGIYKGGVPIHKFAEPETRWEAYISGKPGQEDRNRQIWVETGRRLGMGDMGGSPAPTQVSLAGARFTFEVEGRPFTGIIREQIAGASVVAGSRVRQGSDRRF